MASVVVEQHGAPEEKIAEASMVRYTGSIISLVLDGFTLKTSWFRILVPLQCACAVLSQLSSTFLFSDFGSSLLPGFPIETSIKYDFNSSNNEPNSLPITNPLSVFSDKWNRFQPATFEPFAEHSRPDERIADDTLDDTGPSWRAFLPLGAYDNNTNINKYNGVARVVDTRTICVRPDIQTFSLQGPNATLGGGLQWAGNVRVNASRVPDVLYAGEDGIFEEDFACPLVNDTVTAEGHTWMQCELNFKAHEFDNVDPGKESHHRIPTLDPLFYNRSAIDILHAEWVADSNGTAGSKSGPGWGISTAGDVSPKTRILATRTGQTQILLGARYDQAGWETDQARDVLDQYGGGTDRLNMSLAKSPGEGPWNIIEVKAEENGKPVVGLGTPMLPMAIRATYCWDVMSHGNAPVPYLNIAATSKTTVSPPVTSWNERAARYITDDVRRQLGATSVHSSLQDRAVLALTRESLEHAIQHDVKPADVASYVIGINTETADQNAYRTYLTKRSLVPFSGFYGEGTQIFWQNLLTDTLEDSGSPALAIQAINTAASRMIYTHWMGSFTLDGTAEVTYLTDFRIPVGVAGYSVVTVVIATQIALLVIVGAMFSACANSVLNNAWLVMSQVSSSPAAVGDLVRSRGVTDEDVGRYMKDKKGVGMRRRLVVRDGAFQEFGSD